MPRSVHSKRYQKFLELLVAARKATGMTQRSLAARLKIPYATVANIETGQRRVDVAEFIELVEILDMDAAETVSQLSEIKDKSVFGRKDKPGTR